MESWLQYGYGSKKQDAIFENIKSTKLHHFATILLFFWGVVKISPFFTPQKDLLLFLWQVLGARTPRLSELLGAMQKALQEMGVDARRRFGGKKGRRFMGNTSFYD